MCAVGCTWNELCTYHILNLSFLGAEESNQISEKTDLHALYFTLFFTYNVCQHCGDLDLCQNVAGKRDGRYFWAYFALYKYFFLATKKPTKTGHIYG